MAYMVWPPSIKKNIKYDPSITFLVDDETLEWSRFLKINFTKTSILSKFY